MLTFHQPSVWILVLLVLVPVLWWRWTRRSYAGAMAFSSVGRLAAIGTTWVVRLRWIIPALRSLALALLIVAVARPQRANERTRIFSEGVAIQLIVDRSGSMLAMDFKLGNKPTTRLDAVKHVVRQFVEGGDDLPGRPDDLIGLITFASYADSVCPLTLDHEHLVRTVADAEVATQVEGSGTAIGDAVALGVERMRGLDDRADLSRQAIKSRVMILLSDGENREGDIDPLTAAEMAAAFGIRIYSIGVGSNAAMAPIIQRDPFSGRNITQRIPVSIDEKTLTEIAEMTGGQYFRATDSASLQRIYARIDELERTEIEQRRFLDYRELSVEGGSVLGVSLPPLLSIVLVMLIGELLLSSTRFRRQP